MAKARIEITGNSQSFEQAAKRVNADLKQMNSNAETTGRSVSEFGNKAKAAFAGIVSTAAVGTFVKQMATVRGQFQQYEIALSTMLQSEEKAATLMGELLELAAKTPFDLQGVVEGAKQLMAYGTSAEDMIETLTMLGDVAAGLSIPLGDLVYLYGTTMTQGRVFTMDMRQFMARGIPMAEELAKQFGVTKEAVSGLVTEGKVGADAITKAFQSMTSEGGKFENLMVRQSASITGQISNLQDSIQTMFNDLGKMNEGIIYDAIKGAAYLVEHYEEIGKTVIELIAVYGSYKAALIAVTASHKAYIMVMQQAKVEMALAQAQGIALSASQAKMAATTKLLSGATAKLNKTMLANPYVLVAAAVVGLGYGIYKLTTYQTEYEKSLKKVKETQDEINTSMNEELLQLDILYKRLEKATEGSDEYLEVKEEISSKYGNYLKDLKDEEGNVLDVKDAYVALTEKILETARARAMNESLKLLSDDLVKAQTDAFDKIDKHLEKKYGKIQGAEYSRQIKISLVKGEEFDEELQGVVDGFDKVHRYTTAEGEYMETTSNKLLAGVNKYKKATKEYGELTKEVKSDFADVVENMANDAIENANTITDAVGLDAETLERYQKSLEAAQKIIGERWKEIRDTKDEISKLFRDEDNYIWGESWSDMEDAIQDADAALAQIDADTIDYAKTYDFLGQQASMIFADISELSSSMIRQVIANAEQYVNTNKNLTDEQIAEYRRAIDQANTYLVEKNPWDALKVAQERYVKSIKDYNKAQKAYDLAKQAGDGQAMKEAIEAQNSAILEQASALRVAKQAYEEINTVFRETLGQAIELAVALGMDEGVARSFNQLVSAGSKVASALIKVMDTLGGTASAASTAAKSIGSGASTGSLIGAFIGLMVALAQIMVSIDKTRKAANEAKIDEYVEKINNKVEALKRNLTAISELSGPGDSWFTEDLFNNVVRLNDAFLEAYENLNKLLDPRSPEQLLLAGGGVSEVINNIRMALASVHGGNIDFGEIVNPNRGTYRDWDRISDSIEGSYENLGIYLAELKNIAAEQEALGNIANAANLNAVADELEAYLKAYEALQSAVQATVGDISGSLLNTVRSVWDEFGIAGEDSIARVTAAAKESISEIVDEMVSQQIWATTMSTYFDQLGEGLVAAIGSGDSGALMAVFNDFWSGMQSGLADYNKAMIAFYETAETYGWNITPKVGGDNGAKDSIKAMREELARLQEQWESMSDADRKSGDGKELFGDITDLKKKLEIAENLYNQTYNIAGSIDDINAQLSRLNAELNALSPEDREGAKGDEIKRDIAYYEQLLENAQRIQETELESMQKLIESKEAKWELYQKWIELYGEDSATEMMGDMLKDAEAYLNELRDGISGLQAKVTAGTATDEDISQLTAWEQQYADIQNAAAQAAEEAAQRSYDAWNESLQNQIEGARTDYEKLGILWQEWASVNSQYAEGVEGEYLKQYEDELTKEIEKLSREIEKGLRDKYKTDDQRKAETLEDYRQDIEYAEQILQDMDLVEEIRKQRDEYLSELANVAIESSEEYQLIFGDLQEVSADAFNAAMDNIRKSVEESTELTEEAKTALLNLLDETQKKWDDLQAEKEVEKVKEKFSDLQSVMGDVSGLLNEMGVSDTFSQMFSGLQMIIDGYGQLQIAIKTAKAAQTAMNMATAFGAIATMITGLIRSVGTLVNRIFTITDIEGPLQGLVDTYDKLTRAIDRSVGAQKKARQEEASENLKNQKEELEREYAKEASKWGFSFTILGKKIQILGPDQGVLDELTSQINEVETAMQQLGDTMKSDFLQTDYESFSDALSEILTSPWDSFEDMMGAVDDLVDSTLDRITNKWLTTKFLQGKIDAALENLYAAGDPTQEAYDKFREAVKEASAYYLQEADKLGIGNYSSGSSNSDYDTIRRISAEDFSKWLGEWRAQRIALVDNGNMLKNIYAQLKSLAESPSADPELLDLTRRIEVNTAILPVLLPQILDTLKSNQNGLKSYGY